jgi:hypothetical protein
VIPLSRATKRRIRALFAPGEWSTVEELLIHRCGDTLPFLEASHGRLAERIRFAVLKLSGGNLEDLRRAIDDAQVDWRDILMAAGFGGDAGAHRRWRP